MKKFITIIVFLLTIFQVHSQKSEIVELNGAKIYYEIHGEGEPLLVLHWYMGSTKIYNRWIDGWTEKYQVILPDLRGHGKSTNPKKIFRHKDVAQDIYALIDYLNIKNFKALGASTGEPTLI